MKKTITKLSLNKSTISNLNNIDMSQMVGGAKSAFCNGIPSVPPLCQPSNGVSNCTTRNTCPIVKK